MDVNSDLFKEFCNTPGKELSKIFSKYNNFQNDIKVINVVGTNGKGSVSNYLSKQLCLTYKKVGLFTSPAFLEHNERIKINGINISDSDLKKYLIFFKSELLQYKLNFFEIWTLFCMKYFYDHKVDIAVIEAGIGGLHDCTSLLKNQLVIALTSVSLDHIDILGNSISKIADNKIRIRHDIKTKIFTSSSNIKYKKIFSKYPNITFCDKYEKAINLVQKDNVGLTIEILKYLKVKINYAIFNQAPLLGRFTILKKDPYLIIDGAHNEDGINKLLSTIEELKVKKPIILYASASNKNYCGILKLLLGKKDNDLFITNFDNYRSWDVSSFIFNKENILEFKNINLFLQNNNKRNIIICGSLYFISLFYSSYKN